MRNQLEQARIFHELHRGEKPLVLINAWDSGTAQTVQEAGSPAIATGSWSVAAAHGYEDGTACRIRGGAHQLRPAALSAHDVRVASRQHRSACLAGISIKQ